MWTLYDDACAEIVLPLSVFSCDHTWQIDEHFEGYKQVEKFIELLNSARFKHVKVIDLNHCYLMMIMFSETYRRILEKVGHDGDFFCKVKLLNAWRCVPFVDSDSVLETYEKFGVPLIHSDSIVSPPGDDPASFRTITAPSTDDRSGFESMWTGLSLFRAVADACGLNLLPNESDVEGHAEVVMGFYNAGLRFLEVQKARGLIS